MKNKLIASLCALVLVLSLFAQGRYGARRQTDIPVQPFCDFDEDETELQ